ncbi:TonB family protein [Bacteroides pyogenes DSM 20611 = JCM 6294]|uniref:TonB family protein n=1 Tax=Bacteroides pyogenes DSM 20611 = JCM 6294 TaxID=1121100 RepID=W4PEK8_9BACE|nr:TonB family protein [Bacteroides pyogenes DSM 20611 = JCM 6294]
METGKRICQALKNLRKRIADANEIPFEIEECTHKGDCPGTCPKCESELRYLMESINQREQEGKPVVVDGLMSEAELHQAFDIKPICPESPQEPEDFVLQGMPAPPEHILMGDIAAPSNSDFAAIIARELLAKTDGNIVFSPVAYAVCLKCFRKVWIMIALSMKRLINLSLGLIATWNPAMMRTSNWSTHQVSGITSRWAPFMRIILTNLKIVMMQRLIMPTLLRRSR